MLSTLLIYGGIALTVLGLVGLGACIRRALAIKRAEESASDETRAAMHRLVAMNMASVGTAFFGLALVVVGALLR